MWDAMCLEKVTDLWGSLRLRHVDGWKNVRSMLGVSRADKFEIRSMTLTDGQY